ncbi:4-amino-4-deoxy-L-arabinose transferase-like glycosyltransferase [Christiangramia gaetbulicola]|uniref:4-amino-4-deoxy-L-arabinose transferase-like glycosyltransferase n=2 Tax=Christiangramia gaetbulicola TaxID=703340 RepID=A0A2T6ANC1_9FLAO|nr:4-amino-4-deoxy-L-arabinose transferase-like glycosyltransferase [Christiangramia gaetbulicola]
MILKGINNYFSNANSWLAWLVLVLPVLVIFSITMVKGPYLHPDELVIVDLGRYILTPSSSWSITWIPSIQEPAFLISYLGVVIQEINYEYLGQYGPRIFSLLGGIAAATSLVGWLKKRNIPIRISLLLGLVFLLDPLFVQSYTIGRIDGWCMFLCIGACWLIHGSYDGKNSFKLITAGAMAALALFIWPSAIFLFPLIILEIFEIFLNKGDHKIDLKQKLNILALFILGSLIITFILVLPVFDQFYKQYENIIQSLYANSHAGSEYNIDGLINNIYELPRVLKFSPFLVIAAIIAFIKIKEKGLLISLMIVTALMVVTLVYINRVQYLIPYLLLATSTLYRRELKYIISNNLKRWLLGVMLLWSISLSIVVRSYLVYNDQKLDERMMLYQAAGNMIGEGEHRVYIPYEFYYPGRTFNWEMYRAYLANNNPLTVEILGKVLPRVDHVIMTEPTVEIENEIIKKGFAIKGEYQLYLDPPEPFNGITTNMQRVRNLYSIFDKPYGPYKLYSRESN